MLKAVQVTQKRFSSSLPSLALKNKYKSKGSAFNFKPQKVKPGVYYQPSPSIPLPLQKTPNAFLPKSDIRKQATPEYTPEDVSYMPPLSEISEKKYHLTKEQVEEIVKLRTADPYKYTRKALAEKFGCSEFFVSLVCDCSEERLNDMNNRLEQIQLMWGGRKRAAKEMKAERQKAWYRS